MNTSRKSDNNGMEKCGCKHQYRVHSRKDGRCLGGTEDKPMSCECKAMEVIGKIKAA